MPKEDIELLLSKLSEININLDINNYWLFLLLSFVSAGIGAYFGAYFRKKAQNRAIHEDIKYLKYHAKATTQITEQIKSDLDKKTHEHKFKFEIYYQRSIEVIEKLYEHLSRIESHATTYIVNSDYNQGATEEFRKAQSSVTDFITYSRNKNFWVPQELFQEIEEVARLLDKHVNSIFLSIGGNPSNPETISKSIKVNEEAIKALQNDVPKAKASILNNIRKILEPTEGDS